MELRAQQAMQQYEMDRLRLMTKVLRTEEIIAWLGDLAGRATESVERYVKLARVLDAGPGLVNRLLSTPKFETWLLSADSQILFVDPQGSGSARAGSFVSACLVQALRGRRHATVVSHFCSEGPDRDSEAQVTEVLASFICQLLSARPDLDLRAWSEQKRHPEHYSSI